MAKKIRKLLKSFTLIELIIVIAIIAVLGTAAFLILSQWMSKSRDSRRISDLGQIEKAISISYIKKEDTRYPNPDNVVKVVMGDGGVMWNQGVFGEGMLAYADTLQKMPKDPDGSNYVFSVSDDRKYYELLALLENERNISSILNNTYAYGRNSSFVLTNFDGYLLVFTGTYPTQKVTLLQTPTILINPELLSGVQGSFQPSLMEDILVRDGLIASKPKVLTGDVSTFFDGDDSNNGDAQEDILEIFPDLDNAKLAQIIKKGGASGVVDAGDDSQVPAGGCSAQDLYDDYDEVDYSFGPLNNGQTGTGVLETVSDPSGDYYEFQLGRCENGVLSFVGDTKDLACVNPNQTFDKDMRKCVAPCGGNPLPANTYSLSEKAVYMDEWRFDNYKEWGECTYRCNSGYYYKLSIDYEEDGVCTVSACQGDIPDFAELYGTPDGTWSSGTRTYYYEEDLDEQPIMPSDAKCKFRCADTYEWDEDSQQCEFRPPS